ARPPPASTARAAEILMPPRYQTPSTWRRAGVCAYRSYQGSHTRRGCRGVEGVLIVWSGCMQIEYQSIECGRTLTQRFNRRAGPARLSAEVTGQSCEYARILRRLGMSSVLHNPAPLGDANSRIGLSGPGLAPSLSGATDRPVEKANCAHSQSRQRSNDGGGD